MLQNQEGDLRPPQQIPHGPRLAERSRQRHVRRQRVEFSHRRLAASRIVSILHEAAR